jgi:hypothetical protein
MALPIGAVLSAFAPSFSGVARIVVAGVDLTDEEAYAIRRAAALNGVELAEWMITTLTDAAAAVGPRVPRRALRPTHCAYEPCGLKLPPPLLGRPRKYCPRPRPCRDLAYNQRRRERRAAAEG